MSNETTNEDMDIYFLYLLQLWVRHDFQLTENAKLKKWQETRGSILGSIYRINRAELKELFLGPEIRDYFSGLKVIIGNGNWNYTWSIAAAHFEK